MAHAVGMITEIRLETDELSALLTCPPGLWPAPGQYLAASGPDPFEPLPTILFPAGIEAGSAQRAGVLRVTGLLPASWTAGMQVNLRGPLGNGFRLPLNARRVALASLDGTPARLLPLAGLALAQRAAVAIYARSTINNLPHEVELLPLDLLHEALSWADFLAVETHLTGLPTLRGQVGLGPFQRPTCQLHVLVLAAMPCSGLAECGVCAVPTREGWGLACTNGPVFDFNQIEGV